MIFDDPQHCSVAEIDVGRWVQWSLEWSVSTSRCMVTLRDVLFQKETHKSTVRIEFDEIYHERPPSIIIDSLKSDGDIAALNICIAHFDGTIQRLVIESSDKSSSILAPLIAMADDGGMGLVKFSSLLSSASKDVKMASTLCSIAKNRIVASVHWSSSKSLTLGLRGGDTVLVSLLEESRGSSLPLVEFLFRDTFLLQVLWNGIMQTDNLEKATLGTFTLEMRAGLGLTERNASNRDDIVMAVSSEGVLRIWNTGSKRCTVQASLAQLLNNMLAVEVLEDVVIRATVFPCAEVLQIAIALNFRNRGGGEKEWHICAMEINMADVSSSVIVDNGNRLRVTAVLSPPSSWSPLPQSSPRSPLAPPPPVLLDMQLYPSDSSSVLVTAWKWNPPRNDDPGSLADAVPQTGLCSHLLTPSSSSSGVTARACMYLVEDSGIDSAAKRHTRSAEDVILCGQLVVRVDNDQPVGAQCEALAVKQLQQAMVHRIFAPDRFSLRVIASVLTSGVPVPYRSVTSQELSQATDADAHSELLATCIQRVKDCCVRWSKSRDFGAAASDGDSVHERELKCQARAFLRFIELCQRESDVTHCFTSACLQRPAYMHMADTNVFNTVTSIAVAASRQSLAFTYLTIPTAAVGEKPSTVSVSHSRAAGRAAIAAVSVALALQNDLCLEMDVTLDRTFREHAVLDCRNLNWLGGSISEMAAAVQSSAPAVLLHLQSALPVDSNTAQQGSSHGWLLDYLGDVDEGKEGKGKGDRFTGSVCRYSEPTILDTSTTAAFIDTRKSSSESSEFLRAASRISRSKILGFYRLARLKAVVLSVLSSNSGSLHCSLSSHIDRELLPQALFSVAYWGLLAWLGTVICADSDSLRDSVDLFDLFATNPHADGDAGTVYSHNGCASVWEAFCSSISRSPALSLSHGHLNTTVTHILESSRPGPTSALLSHLTRSMQQSGVSRVASLMLWAAQCQGGSTGLSQRGVVEGSHQSRISSLAEYVVKTRLQTSLALSSFLDCLRQLLRGQAHLEGDDDRDPSASLTKRLRDHQLCEKSHSCLEDLIGALKNPSASSDVDQGEEEMQMQINQDRDLLVAFSEMLHAHGDGLADSGLTALQHRVAVLLRTSSAFNMHVKNQAATSSSSLSLSEEALRVSVTSPLLFLHLHRIAHLTDIVEMTKRIRDITTRPGDADSTYSGAGLAVRANYALADAIEEALSGIRASASSLQYDVSSVLLQLSAEQVVSWSSVFEHAVEQQSFDEALGAVTRLIEIEQSYGTLFAARVAKVLEGFGVSGWRSVLGSLVLHACTSGRLGWLCSLNDTWVMGVHVTGEIAQELDQLASSGRSHSSVDGIVSTSYYECSCVYALSRQNLHKAARISVLQAQTLDLQSPDSDTHTLPGAEQIRALSVATVSLAVIEPQHSAFVLVRSRVASAKNSRAHSYYDDSEDMMVEHQSLSPSDDPLTTHTVQQLSAALHLRLTAAHASAPSSRLSERGRESKQSTALHLSVTLEELSAMNQLRGDFSAGPDASSDIINRCCYGAVPPGQPSSSSGRSAVVYSLAADIVAEQRLRREGVRGSGANDRLHSMYSPQGGGGLSSCEGHKFDPHPWNLLLDILAHFDSPAQNWDLHRSAIEGALKAGIQEVPHALVLSYWRAGGDMGALLRVLTGHGHLLEACSLAARMVTAESPSLSIVSNSKIIVPYTIIDKVIIASNNFISVLQSSSEVSQDRQRQSEELSRSVASLESALTKHFSSLLEAELR